MNHGGGVCNPPDPRVYFQSMKDVDRTKLYNSQRPVAHDRSSDPSPDDKELLVLEARLERATGDDRVRIEELIREILEKKEKENKSPPGE